MASATQITGGSSHAEGIAVLSRAECLELLAAGYFGRIVVAAPDGSVPIVRPVNYVFDPRSQAVIFKTAAGSKLFALLRSSRAAFEIDHADAQTRTGWSVIVRGVAEEVRNPTEIRRLERLGVDKWAGSDGDRWIRVRAGTVSGRRIG